MPPNSRRRSVPDPFPRRWPKITLIAACLAVAGAGWWFYGDDAERWFYGQDAERQGDETISPGVQAGEAPAKLEQAAKPTELKQAEFLSAAYREALEKERRRNTELEQDSANDHQLLAQERERSKGLEQQLSARQDDQQLLAQERERSKGLEQQLSARQNDQQLLAQERERSKGLEQQLAARQNDQQLLAQERERSKGLEQQLTARQNDQQLLAQERERIKGLEQQLAARQNEQQLAAHQNEQQLLAQERERIKGLEQQLAARQNEQQLLAQERERNRGPQQLQQQQQQQLAALQPRQELPAQPEGVKPQPTVRRTGPRPLPNVTQPMPPFTLQASDLTHNPARYWQVTVTLTSNTSRTLDAQIRCSFLNAERSVAEASFGPTTVAPGEQISADLIGPPITAYVVSTTCRLVGQ